MTAKAIEQFQAGVIVAGRYRIVGPLGAGGMGDVYHAVQEPLGREVALKVIRAENQTPELCQRFHSEVRAMAAVKHRGVATVFDFGRKGAKSTHPELLDWLAQRFIDSGWSIKAMHRLILASNTYRMSSTPPAEARSKAKIPDNFPG